MDDRQLKEYAEQLHLLFCKKEHSDDIQDVLKDDCPLCCWWVEEQMENAWEYEAHKTWAAVALHMYNILGGQSEATEYVIVTLIRNLCLSVENIKRYNPKLWDFIKALF